MDVKICGRTIGTCSGYDITGDTEIHFYDFKPNNEIIHVKLNKNSKDMSFDYLSGYVKFWNEDGTEITQKIDIAFVINPMKIEEDNEQN